MKPSAFKLAKEGIREVGQLRVWITRVPFTSDLILLETTPNLRGAGEGCVAATVGPVLSCDWALCGVLVLLTLWVF
jgi:hypothetical protein